LPLGLSINVIGFRPGTSDLGLTVIEPTGNPRRIALWSVSAGLRTVYTFPPDRFPSGPPVFRADGSAVIVDFGNGEGIVVDIATGQSTRLPRSSSQTSYSHPAASIRLD
jgi:hypothetical protein